MEKVVNKTQVEASDWKQIAIELRQKLDKYEKQHGFLIKDGIPAACRACRWFSEGCTACVGETCQDLDIDDER